MNQVRTAKIGLMQVGTVFNGSVQEAAGHLLDLAEQCLRAGADLVFMPEYFQYKGHINGKMAELVKQFAEPYKQRCAQLAKQYNAYVVPWDFELDEHNRLFNTSYILDRDGNEIGRYRKVHVTWTEADAAMSRGNAFPVFDLDFGRVGIMICFDNYFPESSRILGLKGAELILYPLADDLWEKQWKLRTQVRAIDNLAYIASCKCGNEVAFTGMFDPDGEIICELGTDSKGSISLVEIKLGETKLNPKPIRGHRLKVKNYWSKSRNTEAYYDLLKPAPYLKREEYIIAPNN